MAMQRQKDRPSAAPVSSPSRRRIWHGWWCARQTLNAILGKLHEKRLIEVTFRRIRVLDPRVWPTPTPRSIPS
jgi:hypothetical protein